MVDGRQYTIDGLVHSARVLPAKRSRRPASSAALRASNAGHTAGFAALRIARMATEAVGYAVFQASVKVSMVLPHQDVPALHLVALYATQ